MRVEIRGHRLPGRSFGLQSNVHVAVQIGPDPVDPVPADADTATWAFEVRSVIGDDGAIDLRGPAVHGKRNDRFFYLTWGDVDPEGAFEMFRRAKLMVAEIDPRLLAAAAAGDGDGDGDGATLIADVELTDERGGPRCAQVHPPAIRWSVA